MSVTHRRLPCLPHRHRPTSTIPQLRLPPLPLSLRLKNRASPPTSTVLAKQTALSRPVPSKKEAMAKGGLGKLRCMIRRWHSSSRIARAPSAEDASIGRGGSFHGADEVPKGLHPVYVGRARRRYLVAEELARHPLFQTLVDRGGSAGADDGCTVVGCEVVLFEHLLWMLQNSDPQPESLDELVEYYAC
ncbi:hypothetical protein BS78_07G155000 [Paspalum vaginatum]|nr:hypothetical protein BS78_07G155000 [Paspalum vaginatum]